MGPGPNPFPLPQWLRGGVKIENRENLGQCPNREGGGLKKKEMAQFQFGNFENRGGWSLFFRNVPILIWEF